MTFRFSATLAAAMAASCVAAPVASAGWSPIWGHVKPHRVWRNDGFHHDWRLSGLPRPSGIPTPERDRDKGCKLAHLEYVLHHPTGKPDALAGEFGCKLYRDDHAYHATFGERNTDAPELPSFTDIIQDITNEVTFHARQDS